MFNKEKFEVFVRTHINPNKNPHRNKLDKVVAALCQFEETSWRASKTASRNTFNSYIKNNFIKVDKPSRVPYNTYLLYVFGYKCCYDCRIVQSVINFSTKSSVWCNLQGKCKNCESKRDKENYLENKEKIDNQHKKYYRNNKNKILAKHKEWRQNNPDKVKGYNHERRSKEYQAIPPNQTEKERLLIRIFIGNCPKGSHVDHIVPLAKRGTHSLINLQYLTAKENLKKSDKYTYNQDDYFLGRIKWW